MNFLFASFFLVSVSLAYARRGDPFKYDDLSSPASTMIGDDFPYSDRRPSRGGGIGRGSPMGGGRRGGNGFGSRGGFD